jgi:hypothetical protein
LHRPLIDSHSHREVALDQPSAAVKAEEQTSKRIRWLGGIHRPMLGLQEPADNAG